MTEAVNRKKLVTLALGLAVGALAFVALLTGPQAARAASHREAPLISLDPTADITDFFMFRSYEPGNANCRQSREKQSSSRTSGFDPNGAGRATEPAARDDQSRMFTGLQRLQTLLVESGFESA
jgi:hypothetical protein